MSNPVFDSVNPHFRSKYASLASVRNAIVPVFAKHGISCVQELIVNESGKIGCTTRLMHDGEWIEFEPLYLPAGKQDAQGLGSASTYARRYCLQAVAGVVGDDDDDGNSVSEKAKKSSNITPTSGAIERAQERTEDSVMIGWVDKIKAAHQEGDEKKLAKVYKKLKDASIDDADLGAAVWSMLSSDVRSAAKRAAEKYWTPSAEEAAAIASRESAEAQA